MARLRALLLLLAALAAPLTFNATARAQDSDALLATLSDAASPLARAEATAALGQRGHAEPPVGAARIDAHDLAHADTVRGDRKRGGRGRGVCVRWKHSGHRYI